MLLNRLREVSENRVLMWRFETGKFLNISYEFWAMRMMISSLFIMLQHEKFEQVVTD
jgi:hypothetical protein